MGKSYMNDTEINTSQKWGKGEKEYTQGILINEEKMPIHPLTPQICTV